PGEKFDVVARIANAGSAKSFEAVAQLRNLALDSVFIEKGREQLGVVAPGESKTVRFRMSLKDGRPRVDAAEMPIELIILDSVLAAGHGPPTITAEVVPTSLLTAEAHIAVKGKATAGAGVRDVYVYVNDKKVYYRAPDLPPPAAPGVVPTAPETDFDAPVPLT